MKKKPNLILPHFVIPFTRVGSCNIFQFSPGPRCWRRCSSRFFRNFHLAFALQNCWNMQPILTIELQIFSWRPIIIQLRKYQMANGILSDSFLPSIIFTYTVDAQTNSLTNFASHIVKKMVDKFSLHNSPVLGIEHRW